MSELHDIAKAMVATGKGVLAADESNRTATKRLASINMESSADNRRAYRELFLGMDGIENHLSGVILYDETIRQNMSDGTPFVKHLSEIGVIPGIKVDMGLRDLPNFPGETYTQGLDDLSERLKEYYDMGARFTKWRSVINIGEGIPTEAAIHTNAHGMALYALLVQQAGMVPMVEPEVLIEGSHNIERSFEVTSKTLKTLFELLSYFKVDLAGTILKTSMVIPGKDCADQSDAKTIGEMTLKCLKENVPAELGGIVFLSGGQSAERATENLNAVNAAAQTEGGTPWNITFSYARALQGPSLAIWNGDDANIPSARAKFLERLKANSAAAQGQWTADMDRAHAGVQEENANEAVNS
jgi:fructose-bisphosphate aldolase class I